jgi:predicted nucleotidyltransferase
MNSTIKLRVRQIERKVQVPIPSAIRYSKELEKEGLLRKNIVGGVTFYSANRGSKLFLLEKTFFNIKSLHESGLITYLMNELSYPSIILFGSYSRGEDTERSDIDLYLETPSKKKLCFKKFEKKLQREIQIFQHKNIHQITNNHLANNIINGITLNGFVEVVK